ncbi:FtsX-like permease family protein [Staphylococcus sp. 17KM0847]|uniref:FtsX-like permease family protein n=1 Tax=Staphylococcus sp. 17KM0847 TaxID=2583989 RepID=UPI0015DC422D|nr:ABC transporter permease [Staphylococcus sp. 17KM0847]QLK85451.1 ABC transporter permease [Staphylococcus sp. 17KM0847]
MTFNHIIIKNLIQNLKYYAMYLFALMLSITMYFSFVTLKYTKGVDQGGEIVTHGASIGEKFLFIIILVFLMYANHLFIKRRTKSFALFQLIGLSRKDLLRMFILEQTIIFFITTMISIFIGVFGSRLLQLILINILSIPIHAEIVLHLEAVKVTLILIFFAFLLIIFQSYMFIRRRSIVQLMHDSKQSEVQDPHITKREAILGVLGLLMIGTGYYLSTIMFDNEILVTMIMANALFILFLTVLGAYFFFKSSVSLIFKTLKLKKNGNVSITDAIFTASIMYRMKRNAFSLTTIAIISAITISVLSFAALGYAGVQKNINFTTPYEYTYYNEQHAKKFESALQSQGIAYDKYMQRLTTVPVKGKDTQLNKKFTAVSIVRDTEIEGMNVEPGEVKFVNVFEVTNNFAGLEKGMMLSLGKGSHQATLKVTALDSDNYVANVFLQGTPLAVVDTHTYEKLEASKLEGKGHSDATQVGFELKDRKAYQHATTLNKKYNPQNPESRTEVEKEQLKFAGMFLFVSSFLGIAFLVAAGCIIYIKQMDETEDEIGNYQILRKIGYTHQDMCRGLALKVAFNFGLPLIVGLGHAYFAAHAFNVLLDTPSFTPVLIAMAVYSLVYALFAWIAYIHSKRTIKYSL